ncbi:MAG: hypothetical protein JWS12_500 [Candidatus Saccharibacteria bacterium]|nr:hypothetical protein [Candidatus Saccharibacteria bacterium]
MYEPRVELEPGRVASVDYLDNEKVITWPTNLDEKAIIKKLVDILAADTARATWRQQVVANMSVLSVQEFMGSEEAFLHDNSGILRFNTGESQSGFSVTAVITGGATELQGIFGRGSDVLSSSIIEGTIIDSGRDRVQEIIGLGRVS